MASSDPQCSASNTALPVPPDITYRLVYQCVQGDAPEECSNSNDRIHIGVDSTSHLNPRIPSNSDFVVCRVHFSWANHSGDMSGAYDKREDTLISSRLLRETLQRDVGADRVVSGIEITLIKERTQDGKLVENGGRYVRVDVRFAGFPARSAKIWGKRVTGGDHSGPVQFSREEILRLGIDGKKWRWQPD